MAQSTEGNISQINNFVRIDDYGSVPEHANTDEDDDSTIQQKFIMLGNDEGVWPFVDLTMKIIDSHMSNEEGVVLSSTAAATKKKKARVYVAEIRVPRRTKRWIPQPKKAHRIALSERSGASRSNSSDSLRSVSSQSEDGEEESDTAAEPIPALSIPGADLLPPPPEMKAKTPTRAEITEEPTSKDEVVLATARPRGEDHIIRLSFRYSKVRKACEKMEHESGLSRELFLPFPSNHPLRDFTSNMENVRLRINELNQYFEKLISHPQVLSSSQWKSALDVSAEDTEMLRSHGKYAQMYREQRLQIDDVNWQRMYQMMYQSFQAGIGMGQRSMRSKPKREVITYDEAVSFRIAAVNVSDLECSGPNNKAWFVVKRAPSAQVAKEKGLPPIHSFFPDVAYTFSTTTGNTLFVLHELFDKDLKAIEIHRLNESLKPDSKKINAEKCYIVKRDPEEEVFSIETVSHVLDELILASQRAGLAASSGITHVISTSQGGDVGKVAADFSSVNIARRVTVEAGRDVVLVVALAAALFLLHCQE